MSDWLKRTRERIREEEKDELKKRQSLSKPYVKEEKIATPTTRQPQPTQNNKVTKGASSRRTTSDKRVQLGTLEERKGEQAVRQDRVMDAIKGTGKSLMGSYGSAIGTTMQSVNPLELTKSLTKPGGVGNLVRDTVMGDIRNDGDSYSDAVFKNAGRKLTKKSDELIKSGSEDIDRAKDGMGKVGQFAVDVGSQGLMMGSDAFLNLIAPGAGLMGFYGRAAGASASEARREGASEDQQLLYGAASGLMELGLEKLFSAGKYLKGMYGAGALDMATPMASKVATSNLLKGITRSPQGRELVYQLTKAGFAMNEEGIEEALADLISPLLKRAVYTDEIDMPDAGTVLYDYLVGAASGGLFGAAGTVADYKSGVGRMNQMQNAQQEGRDITGDIISRGSVQGEKTSAGQFAQQLSAQRDSGKDILGGQLNDLQRMTGDEQLKREVELRRQKDQQDRVRMAGDVEKFKSNGSEAERRAIVEISSSMTRNRMVDAEKIVAQNEDLRVNLSGDSATFEAVSKVAIGTATAEDIDRILMKPAAKALVREMTGVNLPADNTAARKSLENLVVFTGAENRVDIQKQAKVKVAEDMSSSLGRSGSAVFVDLYKNVADVDNEKFNTIFNRFYNAGTYSMPIEAVSKTVDDIGGSYQAIVDKYFTPEVRMAIHKAGAADSAVETKQNEERVIRHEKVSQRARKGGFRNESTGEVSKPLEKALTTFAKRTGVEVVYVDTLGDSNGAYINGTIYLAKDADNPLITVAKHELTHHLKKFAPKEYQELEDYVFSEWFNRDQGAHDRAIAEKMKRYADAGHPITREGAKEEILADAAEAFFTDDSAIDSAIAYSKKLGEAILDGIRAVLDTFMAMADADDNKQHRGYGKFMKEMGILEEAERKWMMALQASMKNDVKQKGQKNVPAKSLKTFEFTKSNALENMKAVAAMRPVVKVKLMEFRDPKRKPRDLITEFFEGIGTVENDVLGSVALSHRGVKESWGHKGNFGKIGAFRAVPNVIKEGKIIDAQRDWKGRLYDTVVIAAPVEIENVPHYMAVVVKRVPTNNVQRYYLHDVLAIKKEHLAPAQAVERTPDSENAPIYNLLQQLNDVNSLTEKDMVTNEGKFSLKDTEDRELTPEQQKYFAKSKVRDAMGRLKVMYHGTENIGFNTFDPNYSNDGISLFFTDSDTVARGYSGSWDTYTGMKFATAKEVNEYFNENGYFEDFYVDVVDGQLTLYYEGRVIANSDSATGIFDEFAEWTGDFGGSGNYEVYLNLENPLIVNADGNYWDELSVEWSDDLVTTRDVAAYAKENGYDGVIFEKIIDTAIYASNMEKFKSSTVAVAFNSNQVKSVANTEPTADPDIRFSLKEEDEDWLDDVDEAWLAHAEEVLSGLAWPNIDSIMESLREKIKASEEEEKPKQRYREKTKEKGLEAKLTDERIEALFEKYGASKPEYAQAYITSIHPRDFLSLTLPDSELEAWDGYVRDGGYKNFFALDIEKLRSQEQTPFLEIDEKTGRVEGHEGRHRMRALLDAGVTSVPIAVVDYRTKYTKEYKKYQELSAQQWDLDDGPINDNAHATVLDLIPINAANREDIMMMYGGNGDIKFSVKDEITTTESGTVAKHSLKSWSATDKEKVLQNLIDAGYSRKAAEKWIDDVNGVAAYIANSTYLDYDADEGQEMLKNNAEYVKTLDASTLCKKRLLYQGVYNAIQHRLPNTPLMPEDVIRIRELMDKNGLEVPCGICYEESRKKNEGKFAKKWLSEYKGDYIPRLDEVTTTDGRARLKKAHPKVLEDYLKFQKTRGSANPKVTLTRTDYKGEILNLTPSDIDKITHLGGLRVQSFSDFETPHLIDMMQAVLDMAEMKLTSQAYTKVPAFARVFGNTGIKINLSLIGQVDENGKLVFDDKEGMPHEEAFKLREQFSDHVGTILVGANKESILAAWADPRIDMVIPFHRSGWKLSELETLGLTGYRDFTRYQSERYLDGSKNGLALNKVKKKYDFEMEELYSKDYWEPDKTGKENAEIYLKLCAEQKRRPVFYNFLVDNGDGSYSLQPDGSTDGYWKSLVDFKMYNNDGVYSPQTLVQPNFEMDAAYEIMEEYDENPDELPVDNDIVEQFVAEYKAAHPRAKYQLKEGPSYDRKVKTLEERVAYLKSEMKKTGLKTPVEKDTKVQASKLLKKYDSNMVLHTKLVDTMKDIFKVFKTTTDWTSAEAMAEDMARQIVDKIAILHDESWQEYKELRKHLRTVPVAVSEADKASMTDYESFRKANMGRIKLTNNQGLSVDQYYQGLMENWPEKFTDEYTNTADQLYHIEDVLNSLAPWYETYDSDQMQELVLEIADDIMATTGMLATRKTFADRKAEEKERAVDRVKRQRDEAMERMKERYEEKLIRQNKTSKEKMDAYKEKQKDRASRKKAMDRIQKNFDWLRERLLNPSDVSHIPEGYRAAVAELLEGFDFETDRTDAYEAKNGASKKVIRLRAFKDRFRQIMESPEGDAIELDPDFMAYMDEITDQIDGHRLSELDNVTLENVGLLLKRIKHQMSYINKCFNDDISEGIHELGESTIWEANEQKEAKEYTSVKLQVNKLLNESMVTPADMFELIGGAQKKLYQGMRNGFDRHVQNVQMAIQFTQSTIGDAKVKDWSQNKHTFTLESGKVEMTTTQLMSLYALMQREQAQGHILGSGIVMAPIELKGGKLKAKQKMAETHVMPTLEEVLEMIGVLTDEQRRIADDMRGFLSNECSEWGNRTSMKLYGYRKFTEKDYFPIKSSDSFLNENFDQKNVETSLKSMGFTKAVVREASNPIVIDDFFTVFTDHVNKMSMYEALVPAMTDFQRVYNYKQKADGKQVDSVQKALKRAYGTSAISYIKQFMEDLNGSQRTRNDAGIATGMISTYKKASIGANLRVLLQQPTSLVRAFAVINPKYFSNTPATKKDIAEMKEHCSIAQWKSYGFYNTDVARDMKDIMMGESNLVDDVFMGTYGKADDWTWACIWKAVKKEVEAKNTNLKKGSDEYWQKVNERASYVYDRTQVVDSVFHRSQIMRNKGTFEKMATSFMAEPTKTYNLLRTEIITAKRELTEGKKKEAAKRVSGILSVYLLANMTTAMFAAIADAMRGAGGDDEEDKGNFGQRWWAHSIANFKDNANPLNMIPFAKDVVSMYSGYDVARMDMQGISKLLKVQSMWEGLADGSSKYTYGHVIRTTAETMSYFTGVPVKNFLRDVEGITKSVAEAFGYGTAVKFEIAKWTYTLSEDSKNRATFADLYYDALAEGDRALANEILRYMRSKGVTEKYIKNRKKTWSEHNTK